jgi:hypothetical protein
VSADISRAILPHANMLGINARPFW